MFVKLRVHSLDATDDAGRQQAATPAAKPASTQGPEQQKKTSQSQLKKRSIGETDPHKTHSNPGNSFTKLKQYKKNTIKSEKSQQKQTEVVENRLQVDDVEDTVAGGRLGASQTAILYQIKEAAPDLVDGQNLGQLCRTLLANRCSTTNMR